MRHVALSALLICASLCIHGCEPITPAPPPPATEQAVGPAPQPEHAPETAPTPSPVRGYQPEYTLSVEVQGSGHVHYIIRWSALVNTGGWRMTKNEVAFDDVDGAVIAVVFVTLEQPGPDEMTTQALETLTGTHDAGHQVVDYAELMVRRVQRDVTPDEVPEYALVELKSE
jgi:hypothetical protein